MLRRVAWGVLAYNLAVILWGAFVRATGSGAGCGSHWPTCNGEVIPRDPSIETLIELTHRATSGVAFLLVLGVMIAALRARPKGHPMRGAAVAAFVFMVLEAAVGAGLVLLELVADNQSMARAGWMAVHLVNTFLLVACLTLTAWWAAPDAVGMRWRGQHAVAGLLGVALVATLGVGVTGAVTALGDTLFPAESLAQGLRDDLSPTAHFLVRLRVWHPVSAVLVGLYTAGAAGIVAMMRPDPAVRRLAAAVVGMFVLQIGGGLLNLVLLAPTWMQLVHLLMADVLWIALVGLGAEALRPAEVASRAETVSSELPSVA
jgi:heme A synthase